MREYDPSLATDAEVPIIRLRTPSRRTILLATVHIEPDPEVMCHERRNIRMYEESEHEEGVRGENYSGRHLLSAIVGEPVSVTRNSYEPDLSITTLGVDSL